MINGYVFAIITGIFYGLQGTFGKVLGENVPPLLITWSSFTFSFPFLLILLFMEGPPAIIWEDFFWSFSVSFIINVFAFYLFFYALNLAPLSRTMPFTAFTPLFLIPVAYVLLGEFPNFKGILGIVLIIVGGYGIHLETGNLLNPFKSLYHNKGTRLMLIIAFVWSISATVEKVAVLSSSQVFYGVVIQISLSFVYTIYLFIIKRMGIKIIKQNIGRFLLLGLITGSLILFQFTALKYLFVSYVIAFKRAGVIVSVFLGYLLFRERGVLKNIVFTILMVIGVFLIML